MKTTVKKPKKTSFKRTKRKNWLKKHGMTLAIVVAALLIVVVIGAIIGVAVKSSAERTRNQLASADPAPTTEATTEVVELPGVSDVAEVTSTEEPTTEVEEETEEVTEATEEATEEETEEETTEEEAQPTEGAQPTVAQPTQQAQQPTQQQPTQPTQPTGGSSSWSYQYHNDNGVVTVSTSGDFPEGVDPNNPASVQQWIESQTGVDYSYFFQ